MTAEHELKTDCVRKILADSESLKEYMEPNKVTAIKKNALINAINLTKFEEGSVRDHIGNHSVYICPAGHKTIGYGHRLYLTPEKGKLSSRVDNDRALYNSGKGHSTGLSEETAFKLLVSDFTDILTRMGNKTDGERVARKINPIQKHPLNVQLGLSCIIFQVGMNGFFGNHTYKIKGFAKCCDALKDRNYIVAAREVLDSEATRLYTKRWTLNATLIRGTFHEIQPKDHRRTDY